MASPGFAIEASKIGKRYRIGQRDVYRGLRHVFNDAASAPFRALRRTRPVRVVSAGPERIWALEDVSFEVAQGEVLGLIGRNGAGKSTLLKILARITEPTTGHADVRGRVGSLLEVGTGFHPELTGRENVLLNGIILGMRRKGVERRFDEIVEFAGVERFIDTPVKRYSSGMQVRLAFAVAAHLQPEILLVDEVLAVGDAEFQRKCLGKMQDVTDEGRTVLFVSHNMSAIRSLCSRTMLLDGGTVVLDGPTEEVLPRYLETVLPTGDGVLEGQALVDRTELHWLQGPPLFRPTRIAVVDAAGVPRSSFRSSEEVVVEIDYEVTQTVPNLIAIVHLVGDEGELILRSESADDPATAEFYTSPPGSYRARCTVPANLLGERRFYINAYLASPEVEIAVMERVLEFDVSFIGYNDNLSAAGKQGFVRPQLDWKVERA